jgi:hypothetical protein
VRRGLPQTVLRRPKIVERARPVAEIKTPGREIAAGDTRPNRVTDK